MQKSNEKAICEKAKLQLANDESLVCMAYEARCSGRTVLPPNPGGAGVGRNGFHILVVRNQLPSASKVI